MAHVQYIADILRGGILIETRNIFVQNTITGGAKYYLKRQRLFGRAFDSFAPRLIACTRSISAMNGLCILNATSRIP